MGATPMQSIVLDGVSYHVVGYLDGGHKLAVADPNGVNRILIRDTLDGPWRRWAEADRERDEAQARQKGGG